MFYKMFSLFIVVSCLLAAAHSQFQSGTPVFTLFQGLNPQHATLPTVKLWTDGGVVWKDVRTYGNGYHVYVSKVTQSEEWYMKSFKQTIGQLSVFGFATSPYLDMCIATGDGSVACKNQLKPTLDPHQFDSMYQTLKNARYIADQDKERKRFSPSWGYVSSGGTSSCSHNDCNVMYAWDLSHGAPNLRNSYWLQWSDDAHGRNYLEEAWDAFTGDGYIEEIDGNVRTFFKPVVQVRGLSLIDPPLGPSQAENVPPFGKSTLPPPSNSVVIAVILVASFVVVLGIAGLVVFIILRKRRNQVEMHQGYARVTDGKKTEEMASLTSGNPET